MADKTQQLRKPSCAVCWEDFDQVQDLVNHIRTSHPDRICEQEELFARREVAQNSGTGLS